MSVHENSVYVVGNASLWRRSTTAFLKTNGISARPYVNGLDFVESINEIRPGCVLLDHNPPETDGIQALKLFGRQRLELFPTIVVAKRADVSTVVQAMQLGATDFLEAPVAANTILQALERAYKAFARNIDAAIERERARRLAARLSPREGEVLLGLVSGQSNKIVARELDLSVRTIEMHRGNAMARLGVNTLGEAMRIAFLSGMDRPCQLDP